MNVRFDNKSIIIFALVDVLPEDTNLKLTTNIGRENLRPVFMMDPVLAFFQIES